MNKTREVWEGDDNIRDIGDLLSFAKNLSIEGADMNTDEFDKVFSDKTQEIAAQVVEAIPSGLSHLAALMHKVQSADREVLSNEYLNQDILRTRANWYLQKLFSLMGNSTLLASKLLDDWYFDFKIGENQSVLNRMVNDTWALERA